jgi:hypothetical protein
MILQALVKTWQRRERYLSLDGAVQKYLIKSICLKREM